MSLAYLAATGTVLGPEAAGITCGVAIAADVADSIFKLFGLFEKPSFHGSLKPRPSAQPWDEGNILYGPNIAAALGLPDNTCDFGPCGGGSNFQAGVGAIGGTIACQIAEPCGAFEDIGLVVGAIGVGAYDVYQFAKGGKQNIVPSWAEGSRPNPGESASDFADRLCEAQYPPNGAGCGEGPGSQRNKIRKWARDKFGI